jgi:predicted dehydrogenase
MKKFLICGLGAIGQRHVRMIQKATNYEAEIAAYRSRRLEVVISDRLEAEYGSSPSEHYGLKELYSWEEVEAWKPDAVFVTNPISMHVSTAKAAAELGANIFVEKPLDRSMDSVDELASLIEERSLTCMVGYQQRYHPGYQRVKDIIESGLLGKLTSADLHFGEWLPGMHPYEDYRESHAARSDQGGGVILCLSHEIDMAYWMFGMPKTVYALGGHLSNLEMDVEDTADIFMTCSHSGRDFPVHIHLDFLQKPSRRYIHVVGELGSVTYDYPESRLELNILGKGPEIAVYDQFQRNDMFLNEVADFIAACETKEKPPIPLNEGIDVLSICLAAKQSLTSGKIEYLA